MSDIQKQIDDLFEEYIPSSEMVERVSSLIAEEVEEYNPEMITEDFIEEAPKSYIDQLADQMSRVAKRTESAAGQERLSEEQVQLNNFQLQIDNIRRSLRENTMVGGIGQGGDGQTPGSGEVLFSRLDDVHTENIQDGQTIIWDGTLGGFYPGNAGGGGGAVDSVNGEVGAVVLDHTDVGAASAAQGTKADNAVQPGDDISGLNNDAGYITAADIPADAVTSIIAGDGISLDQGTGDVTVTATGPDAAEVGTIINNTVDANYVTALGFAQADQGIEWKTPQQYGAAGDGTTDDTAAIKSWLQQGGQLYLPDGVYLIDVQAGDDGVRAVINKTTNVVCHPNAVLKAGVGLDYDMVNIRPAQGSYVLGNEISLYWMGGTFDMRDQATSTSVPFGTEFPAAGPGGQGTSGITNGLGIRGEVDVSGTKYAGLKKCTVSNVRCVADDTNDPHWQRSGGDSGISLAGAIHQDVSDCTFFGCRDLGIYGSGLSTGDPIPNSSAVYRNNVFTGCVFGVTMKRNIGNVVMTGNVGINCGGLCAASDATLGTGPNFVIANNVGKNCGYIADVKLADSITICNNSSYEHGHLDKDGNEFTQVFNSVTYNACAKVEGSTHCSVSNNVVHSVDSNITSPVYTVLFTNDGTDNSRENFAWNNVGRGVDNVVKDNGGNAEYTYAWDNVGRDMVGTFSTSLNVAGGSVDRSGAMREDFATGTLTGSTAVTELKNQVIRPKTLQKRDRIRVTASGTITGTTGEKQLGLRASGASFRSISIPAAIEGDFYFEFEIGVVSTTSQRMTGRVICNGHAAALYKSESANTDVDDYDLRLCGRLLDATDQIQVFMFRVDWV